ncbi:MAG: hypothetical protein LUD68_02410 [Rikenellaceae bacterium]|nr:hypothetical protein [Rikenellaceae bacterium]
MKYHLLIAILFFLPIGPRQIRGQENPLASPKYQQRHAGSANLSHGIHWPAEVQPEAFEELRDFFQEQGVLLHTVGSRKSITLQIRHSPVMAHVPDGADHGYAIRITPLIISVEYQTPQDAALAVRQFTEIYRRQVTRKELIRKKVHLPCYEIRSWLTEQEIKPFRWTAPGTEVPLGTATVEMWLTDPIHGWYGAADVLAQVGYQEPICTTAASTYTDIEAERVRLMKGGTTVVPVFNLCGANRPFEQVTGHPMLSVEGMRFVQAILGSFLEETRSPILAIVVPQGRYREQIRRFLELYPQISEVYFMDP